MQLPIINYFLNIHKYIRYVYRHMMQDNKGVMLILLQRH
jgi:hypothetical protein